MAGFLDVINQQGSPFTGYGDYFSNLLRSLAKQQSPLIDSINSGGYGPVIQGVQGDISPPATFNDRFAPATNSPLQAAPLPSPTGVAALPQGGAGVPQDQNPTVPQNAVPAAFMGQQPSLPQQPTPQPQGPSKLAQIAALLDPSQRSELKIMQDFLGNQVPYWANPVTGQLREATIGSPTSAGSSGIASADLINAMKMPQQLDPTTGRDENFIKSLGPVLGAQVTSALNGDSKLDGRMLQKIQPLATRAEPGWTQQTYQQRLGAYKSFYGGGKDQETARALNQSIGHFRELVDQMPGLPGTDVPLLNWAKNTFDTQFRGKGTANNFIVNAHALAAELSRLFKQVNMSDTEIKAWESKLTPDMSVEQQRGMVRTLHGLYDEAAQALEKKRVDGLGPALAGKSAPLFDRHAQENLNKVQRFGIGQTTPAGGLPPGWSVTVK